MIALYQMAWERFELISIYTKYLFRSLKKKCFATKYVSKRCTGILPFTCFSKVWRQILVYVLQATSPMEGLFPDLLGHPYVHAQSEREMDGKLGSHSYFPTKWNYRCSKRKVIQWCDQCYRKTHLIWLYFPDHYSYVKPSREKDKQASICRIS